jgi:peptidoglycan-associated lipoprotein
VSIGRLRAVALLLAAVAAAGCGGRKRPPAIATAGMATPTPAATPEPAAREPVEAGPDVRPLADEAARSEELPVEDATGEGGPLEDIHFEYDQAALTEQARSILERHAAWLRAHRGARVRVEGHCDERGTVEYNLALGEKRADTARVYLVGLGIGAERLDGVSFGKERPLDSSHDESAWAKNRRAHFAVFR